jgi:hypothetical protein
MKVFDNALIINAIDKHKENIVSADIGMFEDWFWTAEPIFENDAITQDLSKKIATSGGVNGSDWATPIIRIKTKDDQTIEYQVYTTDEQVVNLAKNEHKVFMEDLFKRIREDA